MAITAVVGPLILLRGLHSQAPDDGLRQCAAHRSPFSMSGHAPRAARPRRRGWFAAGLLAEFCIDSVDRLMGGMDLALQIAGSGK